MSVVPTLEVPILCRELAFRGWDVRSVFAGASAVWFSVVSLGGVRCTACVTTYSARMHVRGEPETARCVRRRFGPSASFLDEHDTVAMLLDKFALANPRAA